MATQAELDGLLVGLTVYVGAVVTGHSVGTPVVGIPVGASVVGVLVGLTVNVGLTVVGVFVGHCVVGIELGALEAGPAVLGVPEGDSVKVGAIVEGLDVGVSVVGAEEGERVLVGDVVASMAKIANACRLAKRCPGASREDACTAGDKTPP